MNTKTAIANLKYAKIEAKRRKGLPVTRQEEAACFTLQLQGIFQELMAQNKNIHLVGMR